MAIVTINGINVNLQLKVGYCSKQARYLTDCGKSRDIHCLQDWDSAQAECPDDMSLQYFTGFDPVSRDDFLFALGYQSGIGQII